MVGEVTQVRQTPGGAAWQARMAEAGPQPLMLGMPKLADIKTLSGS